MSFTVAIIGRPNVGKSTLFNRLVGEKKAIIDDISGVTRDRLYAEADWGGKVFDVIDTGGFVPYTDDVFEKAIKEQVQIAIEEADLILFLVDVKTGITDLDDEVAQLLRKTDKTVLVVVNKVDNTDREYQAAEFYSLGFDQYFNVSSINGRGTGDLLDAVIAEIPEIEDEPESNLPKIAIVGQPNVGKSSLTNTLLGEERNIVTDIAGTTRDSINSYYNKFGKELILVDTAGLRKKTKVHENLEFYSVIRAIKAIDESDIMLLMVDAKAGIEQQDLNIFRLATQKKKGLVIAINKWDLIEKEDKTMEKFMDKAQHKIAPFTDVPIIFTSVKEKQRINKLLDICLDVHKNMKTKVPTSVLNEVIQDAVNRNHPPAYKGKFISIKYATQLPTAYPAFALFCNHPKYIRAPYKQYLENRLREAFNFTGVPISIFFRQK